MALPVTSPQFRPDRITLSDEGAEGGTGGGGPSSPGTLGPIGSVVARQEMEKGLSPPDADSGKPGTKPEGEGKPEGGSPPVETKPDSEGKPEGKPETEGEEKEPTDPEARVVHAKARMHAATTKAAQLEKDNETLRKDNADATAKVALANKYVDWDKLSAYDKEQVEVELGRPLTRKDLEELKSMAVVGELPAKPVPEEGMGGKLTKAQQEMVDGYVEKFLIANPHVLPYAQSREADGVVKKFSAEVEKELAGKSELEMLEETGKRVAEFFRKRDAEKLKEHSDKLTTRRTSLEQGGLPRAAGGSPPGSAGEEERDDPSEYVSERQARQARMLSPGR